MSRRIDPVIKEARKKAYQLAYRADHREELLAYLREYAAKRLAAMTPEELEAHKAKNREKAMRHYWKHHDRILEQRQSPEHKAYMRRYHQQRREGMCPEELEAYRLKRALQALAHYWSNRDKILERLKTPQNRAKAAERGRRRRASLPRKIRVVFTRLQRARRENARRRALLAADSKNDLTTAQAQAVIQAAQGVCVYCPYYHPECTTCRRGRHKLTLDHIIPLANGGHNTLHNLVAVCQSCNSKKRTRPNPVPVQPLLL